MSSCKIVFIALVFTAVFSADASAQLFRGGVVRRLFGRNNEQAKDKDEKDKDKEKDKENRQQREQAEAASRAGSRQNAARESNNLQKPLTIFDMELSQAREASPITVTKISNNGDAYAAGIRRDDQIVAVAGIKVDSLRMLVEFEEALRAGDRIDIEVVRRDDTKVLQFVFDHLNVEQLQPQAEASSGVSPDAPPHNKQSSLRLAPSRELIDSAEEIAAPATLSSILETESQPSAEAAELDKLLQLLRQQQQIIESQAKEITRLKTLVGKRLKF